jgi:hypothetical protein
MTLSEFQELLLLLSPTDLERFFVQVLSESGRFNEVHVTGSAGAADRGVDVEAIERGPISPRKWYFQVKKVKVARPDIVRYMSMLYAVLKSGNPGAEVALVLTGTATRETYERLRQLGVHVWDATKLYELALSTPSVLASYFGTERVREEPDVPQSNRAKSFSVALDELKPGREQWSAYQRLVADILEFLFCPPLEPPRYEFPDAEIRNRRDLIFENGSIDGFWTHLRLTYSAHYIVVDAKNYVDPITKGPVLDIAHYLKPYGCGMFALLATRKGAKQAAMHAVREQWIGSHKMIVVLSDLHMKEMLNIKEVGGRPEETIRRLIGDFRMVL